MKYLSICSGVEAATVAWHHMGWTPVGFSEIEPFPSAVLKHHYPSVPNYGDMTTIPDRILSGEIEAPDLLVGGTPCQAFSIAGLRNSLEDARGNLSLVFIRIANATDHVRAARGQQPCIILWENVPGVYSTKDNAFGSFLAGLADEDTALQPPGGKWTNAGAVFSPKRAVAWRTLDAQYFGVAQRRRRCFVVASARTGFNPAAVLFEFGGVRRDSAPSRSTGQSVAGYVESSFGQYREDAIAGTSKASGGVLGGGSETFITQEVVGTLDRECGGTKLSHQTALSGHLLPVVQVYETHPADSRVREMGDVCQTVTSRWGTGGGNIPLAMQSHPLVLEDQGGSVINTRQDGTVGTLRAQTHGHEPSVLHPMIFQDSQFGVKEYDSAGTIRAGRIPEHQMVIQNIDATLNKSELPLGFNGRGDGSDWQIDMTPTMRALANTNGKQAGGAGLSIMHQMAVRRLTPIECERLQGFPDNYTNIPWRKKPESPDSPRYKAMGNSMAVPVMRWIGKRIQMVENNEL